MVESTETTGATDGCGGDGGGGGQQRKDNRKGIRRKNSSCNRKKFSRVKLTEDLLHKLRSCHDEDVVPVSEGGLGPLDEGAEEGKTESCLGIGSSQTSLEDEGIAEVSGLMSEAVAPEGISKKKVEESEDSFGSLEWEFDDVGEIGTDTSSALGVHSSPTLLQSSSGDSADDEDALTSSSDSGAAGSPDMMNQEEPIQTSSGDSADDEDALTSSSDSGAAGSPDMLIQEGPIESSSGDSADDEDALTSSDSGAAGSPDMLTLEEPIQSSSGDSADDEHVLTSSSSSDSGAAGSPDMMTQEGAIEAVSQSFSWLEEELFFKEEPERSCDNPQSDCDNYLMDSDTHQMEGDTRQLYSDTLLMNTQDINILKMENNTHFVDSDTRQMDGDIRILDSDTQIMESDNHLVNSVIHQVNGANYLVDRDTHRMEAAFLQINRDSFTNPSDALLVEYDERNEVFVEMPNHTTCFGEVENVNKGNNVEKDSENYHEKDVRTYIEGNSEEKCDCNTENYSESNSETIHESNSENVDKSNGENYSEIISENCHESNSDKDKELEEPLLDDLHDYIDECFNWVDDDDDTFSYDDDLGDVELNDDIHSVVEQSNDDHIEQIDDNDAHTEQDFDDYIEQSSEHYDQSNDDNDHIEKYSDDRNEQSNDDHNKLSDNDHIEHSSDDHNKQISDDSNAQTNDHNKQRFDYEESVPLSKDTPKQVNLKHSFIHDEVECANYVGRLTDDDPTGHFIADDRDDYGHHRNHGDVTNECDDHFDSFRLGNRDDTVVDAVNNSTFTRDFKDHQVIDHHKLLSLNDVDEIPFSYGCLNGGVIKAESDSLVMNQKKLKYERLLCQLDKDNYTQETDKSKKRSKQFGDKDYKRFMDYSRIIASDKHKENEKSEKNSKQIGDEDYRRFDNDVKLIISNQHEEGDEEDTVDVMRDSYRCNVTNYMTGSRQHSIPWPLMGTGSLLRRGPAPLLHDDTNGDDSHSALPSETNTWLLTDGGEEGGGRGEVYRNTLGENSPWESSSSSETEASEAETCILNGGSNGASSGDSNHWARDGEGSSSASSSDSNNWIRDGDGSNGASSSDSNQWAEDNESFLHERDELCHDNGICDTKLCNVEEKWVTGSPGDFRFTENIIKEIGTIEEYLIPSSVTESSEDINLRYDSDDSQQMTTFGNDGDAIHVRNENEIGDVNQFTVEKQLIDVSSTCNVNLGNDDGTCNHDYHSGSCLGCLVQGVRNKDKMNLREISDESLTDQQTGSRGSLSSQRRKKKIKRKSEDEEKRKKINNEKCQHYANYDNEDDDEYDVDNDDDDDESWVDSENRRWYAVGRIERGGERRRRKRKKRREDPRKIDVLPEDESRDVYSLGGDERWVGEDNNGSSCGNNVKGAAGKSNASKGSDWFDDPKENLRWQDIRQRIFKSSPTKLKKISSQEDGSIYDKNEANGFGSGGTSRSIAMNDDDSLASEVGLRSTKVNNNGFLSWEEPIYNDIRCTEAEYLQRGNYSHWYNRNKEYDRILNRIGNSSIYHERCNNCMADSPNLSFTTGGRAHRQDTITDVGYNSDFEGDDSDGIFDDACESECEHDSEDSDDLAEKALDSLRFLPQYRCKQDSKSSSRPSSSRNNVYNWKARLSDSAVARPGQRGSPIVAYDEESKRKAVVMICPLNDVNEEKSTSNDVGYVLENENISKSPSQLFYYHNTSLPSNPSSGSPPLTPIHAHYNPPIKSVTGAPTYSRYAADVLNDKHFYPYSRTTHCSNQTYSSECEVASNIEGTNYNAFASYTHGENPLCSSNSWSHCQFLTPYDNPPPNGTINPFNYYNYGASACEFDATTSQFMGHYAGGGIPLNGNSGGASYSSHDYNQSASYYTNSHTFTNENIMPQLNQNNRDFRQSYSENIVSKKSPKLTSSAKQNPTSRDKSADASCTAKHMALPTPLHEIQSDISENRCDNRAYDNRCFEIVGSGSSRFACRKPYGLSPTPDAALDDKKLSRGDAVLQMSEASKFRSINEEHSSFDYRRNFSHQSQNNLEGKVSSVHNFVHKVDDSNVYEHLYSDIDSNHLSKVAFGLTQHSQNHDNALNGYANGDNISGYIPINNQQPENYDDGQATVDSRFGSGNSHVVDGKRQLNSDSDSFFSKGMPLTNRFGLDASENSNKNLHINASSILEKCTRCKGVRNKDKERHGDDISVSERIHNPCTCIDGKSQSPLAFYNEIMSKEMFLKAVKSDHHTNNTNNHGGCDASNQLPDETSGYNDATNSEDHQKDWGAISSTSHKWLKAIPASCLSHTLCARYPIYKKIRNALCRSDNLLASSLGRLQSPLAQTPVLTPVRSEPEPRHDNLYSPEPVICSQPTSILKPSSSVFSADDYIPGKTSHYSELSYLSHSPSIKSLIREPPDGTANPDDPVERKSFHHKSFRIQRPYVNQFQERVDDDSGKTSDVISKEADELSLSDSTCRVKEHLSNPIRSRSPLEEVWDPGTVRRDHALAKEPPYLVNNMPSPVPEEPLVGRDWGRCSPVEKVEYGDHNKPISLQDQENEDCTPHNEWLQTPVRGNETVPLEQGSSLTPSLEDGEYEVPHLSHVEVDCKPSKTITSEPAHRQSTILLAVDSPSSSSPSTTTAAAEEATTTTTKTQQPSLIDLMKLGHYEGYVTLPMAFKPASAIKKKSATTGSAKEDATNTGIQEDSPVKGEEEEETDMINQSTQVRVSLRKYCKRKKDGTKKLVIKFTLCLECAGCKEELVEGQALIALDQQWHIWCFKCAACGTVLHGEYMGKDGLPYCEKDYQAQFGVKCAYCNRFISGKVLQAGDNHHFHPTCARCTKCGDPFGDGEEMYLQGTAIWHPRCGPGPTENGTVLNGSISNGHHVNGDQKGERERDFDGLSSTASETQFSRSRTPSLNGSFRSYSPYNSLNRKFSGPYRTCSPGLILREYKSSQSPVDITRIYTYSYLAAEPSQGYLKRPLDPYDRPPPKSPHFHRPPPECRKLSLPKTNSRLGMRVLVDTMQTETPRPKSPHMMNEEPIALSHYPGGRKPPTGNVSRIERDDFPAPPYPYTDPDVSERRRRWSGSTKAVSIDETDEATEIEDDETLVEDPKLKKEEVELSKIATGIGKVFLQQVKEREKIRAWKATHLDPRNASRSPAADREPGNKLRFGTSLNASPSRMTDHNRPWGPEDDEFDRGSSYRCSTGRSSATIPSYNVVSSLRQPPKPGYGFSPRNTFYRQGLGSYSALHGDYSFSGLGEKTQSTEFSSARSDVSAGSLTDADRSALNAELCASTTYSSGLRGYSSYSPHLRRSLPNMHHMSSEPPKIYPAHLLLVSNYRLPNDVDRCHLERHLSDTDFEMVFHMARMDFYRLPEWRRNDLKRRAKLF